MLNLLVPAVGKSRFPSALFVTGFTTFRDGGVGSNVRQAILYSVDALGLPLWYFADSSAIARGRPIRN